MEIDKLNVLTTIEKLVAAGKLLPQRDRIRNAKDPAAEEQLVLDKTVDLWFDIFSKQHIGVSIWEKATDRAMILNGIAKLETSIINPALMYAALNQVEKEYLEEQQTRYEQEKKNYKAFECTPFPEMGKLVAWHMKNHRQPLLDLPNPDTVRAWALAGGWDEDVIDNNLIKLRVYYCFGQHAKRDGTKMPVRIVLGQDGIASIRFVN